MNIESNVSLRQYNSFGLDAHAQQLARITSVEMLQVVLATHPDTPKYVLGGWKQLLICGRLGFWPNVEKRDYWKGGDRNPG